MPIIAKRGSGSFEPCPTGLHQAVCVDVVDLGEIEVTFGGKTKKQHKVNIVWQTEERMADGRPYTARRRYTLSLDDKASLRKDLESWRGRPFTSEELAGFDLEKLIGVNCQINVMHESKAGETYANVTSIVPLGRGQAKISAFDYVRVKDRDPKEQPQNGDGDFSARDEDVPF